MSEDLSNDALLDAMRTDKKTRQGLSRFALPASCGAMARAAGGAWTHAADETLMRAALDGTRG